MVFDEVVFVVVAAAYPGDLPMTHKLFPNSDISHQRLWKLKMTLGIPKPTKLSWWWSFGS